MVFQTAPTGGGTLVRYEDPQTPIRALRWLQPLPGGLSAVQVVTQSDRQQVSLFKDGVFQASYAIPKPTGVRDGFFRLAELRDACVVDGDVAVLLYALPGGSSDEPSLVLALDLKSKDIRWFHRAPGEHLAAAEASHAVVYLFGAKTPPVRLPLALASKEQTGPTGVRSAARTLELPPEVQEISDLKPTGAWTFLLAHKAGLSAYLGSKGWLHQPLPDANPGWFQDTRGVLSGGPKTYWWQPSPGSVIQVLADGTPKATWTSAELATAEPFTKDASLLHLLGADATGKLWFDLSVPSETAGSAPVTNTSSDPWKPETPTETPAALPTVKLEDWPTYVSQGLDRLYCWDTQNKSLRRFKWMTLSVPEGFQKPVNGVKLVPGSGTLLLENGTSAWLLPLSALPLGEAANTGLPTHAK